MSTKNILVAGFGGQGILFAGKLIAYSGLMNGKEVSWLPSYGPEMRGGTANCSICISDELIGSPLVLSPQGLIVMNIQSYDKFIDTAEVGGVVVIDSTLIDKKCAREDIKKFYIPATKLADENDLQGLASVIMVGKFLKEYEFSDLESALKAIDKCVPPKKAHLVEANKRAINLGFNY